MRLLIYNSNFFCVQYNNFLYICNDRREEEKKLKIKKMTNRGNRLITFFNNNSNSCNNITERGRKRQNSRKFYIIICGF